MTTGQYLNNQKELFLRQADNYGIHSVHKNKGCYDFWQEMAKKAQETIENMQVSELERGMLFD